MAQPRRHREFHFWSAALGDHACRLSVPGRDGAEYWAIVARPSSGQKWREARAELVAALCAAVDAGLEPGEVLVDDAAQQYPRSPHAAQARQDAADEQARGVVHGPPAYKLASGTLGPPRSANSGN
jgi:hypothetical protein